MATIATLAVKLIADAKTFLAAMDQAEKKTQSWSQNVSKNLKDVGGKVTDFGKGMTTYVTLPIIGAGVAATKFASDLAETKNKVSVVFGSMSDDVMKWSANSDRALGLSQQKALDAVGTFGAMGDSAGLSADQNLKWSKSLVHLSSDWSSFYNLNPVDSLNAIQSAVAGQYEPLRRMGIVINQAALEEKALKMGLMEEGGVLSDAARYQALYALMVEKSSAAQGDFARTADGAANQARIVRAQFENAAATIGQQLLPYATQLLGWVSQAITWFQALTPEQQKWLVITLAIVAAIGPLIIVIGSLITAVGAIIPVITAVAGALTPFILPILAIIAVLALLYAAWTNNWFGIQEKTRMAIEFVKSLITGGMQFIQDLVSGKLGWMSEIWQNTMTAIGMIIENGMAIWRHIKQAWRNLENGNWYMFGVELRKIWDAIMRSLAALLGTSWENIKLLWGNALKKLWDHVKTLDWGEVGLNIIKGIGMGLLGGIPMLLKIVKEVGQKVLEAVKGFFSIHSESKVMKYQVGWEMGAGQAAGYEESVRKLLRPQIGMSMPASTGGAMPGMGSVGTMAQPVMVTVDYHPMISTADRNEAQFVLAPMIEDEIRKRERKS
jgi:hypothetical protein